MKIRILGTGTSIPSLARCPSSYLVSVRNKNILVDAGPSVVRRLLEYGYGINDIDIILVTHFHVDHTADLSTFLFACNYGIRPRTKKLLIIGGQGIFKFYKGLRGIYPWIYPKSYKLMIKSMPSEKMILGDIEIITARVNHNRESIGIRIQAGKSVVFSGDTDYSRNLVKLSHGADLLVAECSFPEKKVKGHLNLVTLEKIAGEAGPKKVIISHLYPDWEKFKGVLHPPYLIAEDGMEIDV